MKTQNQTMLSENTLTSRPTDIIAGFPVRPGFFELNGATPLSNGVNFTAHTRHGTSCELLLFHSGEEEPFAVLPFPNAVVSVMYIPWSLWDWTSKIWNTATALTALMNRKKATSSIKQKFFWTLMPRQLPDSVSGDRKKSAAITPVLYVILLTGKICPNPPVRSAI